MPELPDVQVFKEYVDATSLHQRIRHVEVGAPKRMLAGVSKRTLRSHLEGHELTTTARHGKYLFVRIGKGDWLLLHFGMSGSLEYGKHRDEDHVRLRLDFAHGYHLDYRNVRTLGKIGLVDSPASFVAEAELGPDPFARDFSAADLREALEGRRGTIKATMTDQKVLAGIGNIYADEILFQAGVHPRTPTDRLDDEARERIRRAMARVLRQAVEARVERFPRSFLLPHRHEGGTCPHCGAELRHVEVSGRTTYFCPVDQGAVRHAA